MPKKNEEDLQRNSASGLLNTKFARLFEVCDLNHEFFNLIILYQGAKKFGIAFIHKLLGGF